MENFKEQQNQYKQQSVVGAGRRIFSKILNLYTHRRYTGNKSYIYRGQSGRKGKLFINRIKYMQNYKPNI
jgi:hypothetical protein